MAYKPVSGVVHKHGIADDMLPSEVIVQAVAEREGVDETELEILTEVVDPGALDEIVNKARARVEFDYEGYTVIVTKEEVQISE